MSTDRKLDLSVSSLPASRVESSSRLSHLNAPNAYNSIPASPAKYVSSSLNPSRQSTSPSNESIEEEGLIDVIGAINKFEETFTQLTNNVGTFNDDKLEANIESLIQFNSEITHGLIDLENHQELGTILKSLRKKEASLDEKSRELLTNLIKYRNELKTLPKLPTNKRDYENDAIYPKYKDIDITEVLKYASKLAKFTKAPPTVGNTLQIHPNNYVWPAEDALRKGNLALSSIHAEAIIKKELGDIGYSPSTQDVDTKEAAGDSVTKQREEEKKEEKVENKDYYSAGQHQAPETLDLDLFDPEVESD